MCMYFNKFVQIVLIEIELDALYVIWNIGILNQIFRINKQVLCMHLVFMIIE